MAEDPFPGGPAPDPAERPETGEAAAVAEERGGPVPSGRSPSSRSGVVAAGILVSRLTGFARQRAVAHFFGTGPHADVFVLALRAPNVLQNLLGEGTLSASFIPIYSRMLEEGREEEAGRFAGAIFGLLLAVAGGLALVGVLFAEPIVALFAAGFLAGEEGAVDRFPLAVTAVKITFPMTGVLVLHAWALGVLNSHRRFFVPYAVPALWNGTIIAALLLGGWVLIAGPSGAVGGGVSQVTLDRLLFAACFGALAGGFLQFGAQLPLVAKVMRGFRLSLSTRVAGVRRALSAFWPIVAGRGVVQLGAYLDLFLASFLAAGAVGGLGYAQTLYLLPISLFGMSVAAAELPELSRIGAERGSASTRVAEGAGRDRVQRIDRGLRQIVLLVAPTLVGYLAFGYLLAGALFRTGSFGPASNLLVYGILCAYTLGMPASACSRFLQNVFFSLEDTRTPAKVAAQRVLLAAAVALPSMLLLDRVAVPDGLGALSASGGTAPSEAGLRFGAVGLALGSAASAWYELVRLVRVAGARIDGLRLPWRAVGRIAAPAVGAAVPAAGLWWLLAPVHPILTALAVVTLYAVLFLGAARLAGFPELEAWLGRLGGGRSRT